LLAAAVARLSERDAAEAAALPDADLRRLVLAAARTELGQRVRPSDIDRRWAIEPQPRDIEAELEETRGDHGLAAWLAKLSPPDPRYAALRQARRKYLRIVAAGGWPMTPPGPTLRPGDRGPRVHDLRVRLEAEGDAPRPEGDPQVVDAALTRAIERFQRLHGLADDGVLGPGTRAALNVTAPERVGQIEANLERWRWLPRPLPARRFEVDAGAATAALYADSRATLQMRAIVGDRTHHTPMFASRIEAVIFNPVWNVPSSIAAKEILPRARRDPGYLARNGFSFREGRLQQAPGERNSLGAVKFDLPSPFGVYLHDTPDKAAFRRPDRALSHGCVRLEQPRELAAILLAPQGGSRAGIEAAIATGRTERVAIKQPVPLFVVYWTAVATPSGDVEFRPDPYGWDRKLTQALQQRPTRTASSRPGRTDCTD
jgi:murein L,D-transpeptidase YcbB/YkuD